MSKIKNQITLKDIAKKLNVSTVTVSKALRNHPDISEERAKEIKNVAKKLGYIPNIAARNLSAKKTNTIGVIVPVIANSFFANYVESIYKCAFENNYDIILAVSNEDSKLERKHLETMLAMRVDGIIISVAEQSDNEDIFGRIKKMNIPIVFFDRTVSKKEFSSVTLENKKGAYIAVKKAIEAGYKKIGHIGGWQGSNIGKDRFAGYKKALKEFNLSINQKWILFSGFGKKDGENAFNILYEKNSLPEIIFAVTFPVALGVLDAAKKAKVKIPQDLDIICFGDSNINEYLKPSISCVTHNTSHFASQAFKLVIEQVNGKNNTTEKHIEIETEFILKDTCKRKIIKVNND